MGVNISFIAFQAALKVKQKWLKEDWEFFRAQRKLLEQQMLKSNPRASTHRWAAVKWLRSGVWEMDILIYVALKKLIDLLKSTVALVGHMFPTLCCWVENICKCRIVVHGSSECLNNSCCSMEAQFTETMRNMLTGTKPTTEECYCPRCNRKR